MKPPKPVRHVEIPDHARCVFEGVLFSVWQWCETLFDGTVGTFEMARRQDSAVVVAARGDGRLLVTEQAQPGMGDAFYDFPGGRVEPGESARHAAEREMLEETGFASDDLELMFEYQATDRVEATTWVFRARSVRAVEAREADKGEETHVRWLALHEVQREALSNQRLAVAPILLARSTAELFEREWMFREMTA